MWLIIARVWYKEINNNIIIKVCKLERKLPKDLFVKWLDLILMLLTIMYWILLFKKTVRRISWIGRCMKIQVLLQTKLDPFCLSVWELREELSSVSRMTFLAIQKKRFMKLKHDEIWLVSYHHFYLMIDRINKINMLFVHIQIPFCY